MIYQICDVMMSISTWDRVHFWIYLLNHNSSNHQTWPIDRFTWRQYFSEIFWIIWNTRATFQAISNVATCSNYLITNYAKYPDNFFFILSQFLPFYHTNNPQNQNFVKMKKSPGDIIILLKCTKIMIINILSQNNPKNQNFEKMKKALEILSFYTCVP